MSDTQKHRRRTRRAFRTSLAAIAVVLGVACAQRIPPSPTPPTSPALAQVTVEGGREWTDAGVIVRKGERLVFWATGEIRSASRPEPWGPDGIEPSAYRVGKGGLVGRIGDGKPFDIGARTHLIWKGVYRSHRLVTPPPLEMKADGPLRLGVRNWKAGRYDGAYSVSIWGAPADAASKDERFTCDHGGGHDHLRM